MSLPYCNLQAKKLPLTVERIRNTISKQLTKWLMNFYFYPRLLDPSQIARAKKLGGLGLARAKRKNLATLCQWIRTLRFSDELWCKYLIDTINEQGGIRGLRRSKPVGRLWECIIPAMRTILKFFIASGSWHKREEKVFGNDEILSLDAHDFRFAGRCFLYIKDVVDDDGRTREASGRDISFLEKLKFTRICTVIKNKYPPVTLSLPTQYDPPREEENSTSFRWEINGQTI